MKVCTGARKVIVDRLELNLQCQVGIHNSGHCRMVMPGTDVIVMWPGDKSFKGSNEK